MEWEADVALFKALISKAGIAREMLSFLWHRRLWWLIPMVVVLLVFGLLLVLAGSSGLAPFIYSLF